MKAIVGVFMFFSLFSVGSAATAEDVFFDEQFNGPALDPAVWRTEILTSGPRWCDSNPGQCTARGLG